MKRDRLIIFTRYPEPGRAKTRLIPALGERGAADLSRRMAEHTLNQAKTFCRQNDAVLEVRFEGSDEDRMQEWLGRDVTLRYQDEGDLGDRMCHAFEDAFCGGFQRTVIIGTDCPEIDRRILRDAFGCLNDHDLVLGPAHDGGYYLIGLHRNEPRLFEGIPWGTDDVFETTRGIARSLGLSTKILPVLSDVDRPEDLVVWKELETSSASPYLSVIIPTLNESENVARALESARSSPAIEIIIADGGSTDDTKKIARECGARVIDALPGRAVQMNEGAEIASGDVLLFLHADSRLPREYVAGIKEALDRPRTIAGAFRLKFDSDGFVLRLLERTAAFRSRRLKMPYGDQALFVTSAVFRELGGFPDMPLMDDFEFVRRLRRRGRVVTLDQSVTTSSRRYRDRGPIRTTLLNQAIIIGYYLGVSPDRLARWYRGKP